METLSYIVPNESHREKAEAFLNSFLRAGETTVNGSVGFDYYKDYDLWLAYLAKLANGTEKGLGLGVPEVYFAQNENGDFVGIIDVRPNLPEDKNNWGHLGYSVSPQYRRHGYGKQMVDWGLAHLRMQGVKEIFASCYDDNKASRELLKKSGFLKTGSYKEEETGKTIVKYANIKEKENG